MYLANFLVKASFNDKLTCIRRVFVLLFDCVNILKSSSSSINIFNSFFVLTLLQFLSLFLPEHLCSFLLSFLKIGCTDTSLSFGVFPILMVCLKLMFREILNQNL